MISKRGPIGLQRLLLALTTCCLLLALQRAQQSAGSPTVYLPPSMRSEGRIILTYGQGDQITQHHMSFSEAIDAETKRSRISIGYISRKPVDYTTWPDAPTITTDANGLCTRASDKAATFLPELDWFVRMIWSDDEINKFLANEPHLVGPSGLVFLMLRQDGPKKSIMDRVVTHRNIPCKVYTMSYDRVKNKNVEFEIYIPEKAIFDDPKIPFFTAREVTKKVQSGGHEYDVSFTIDYFNIDSIGSDQHKLRSLAHDLNMPLGRLCSTLLPRVKPTFADDQKSFIMSYYQQSVMALTSLAYDHERNYLRKEIYEQTVDIWNLNQDIMYHIDPRSSGKLQNSDASQTINASPCSVMSIWDTRLGSFFRPFNIAGESLDVTSFLGAESIAYVGMGRVRELPCAIYETSFFEPPMVFASSLQGRLKESAKYDYVVQFYLLRTDPTQVYVSSEYSQASRLDSSSFWPIRVSLYRVKLDTSERILLDQLDVVDFHWGLLGANKKPGELFMVRECYDDEDEQTRIELALDFKFRGDLDRKLLAHNKFKLEYDLANELISTLGIARTNIVEFQLDFRPHDLVVEMTLADRSRDKSLVYFGAGTLPESYSYANQKLVLLGLTEERCVSTVSLIDEISFVVYCPFKEMPDVESTCTAVYSETEPVIKTNTGDDANGSGSDPLESRCQVYKFLSGEIKKFTTGLEEKKRTLWQHAFHITVESPITNSKLAFAGGVVGLDISRPVQLMTISQYSFVVPADEAAKDGEGTTEDNEDKKRKRPLVRELKSMTYNNVGDCEKICNLDSSCRSYSYCNSAESKKPGRCVLSSLDIRGSKVAEQLVTKQATNGELEVSDSAGQAYKLKLSSSCSIHERDYLSMFKLTDEVIRLDQSISGQFKSESNPFECAKRSIEAEEAQADHYATMFAYCSYSNTCLFNENLFANVPADAGSNATSSAAIVLPDEDDVEQPGEGEMQCSVYRRKYQNYFTIAPRVFKRQPLKQVELALNTVEECARACWNQFGQVCGSFDYCSPSSCLINDANQLDHTSRDEFEVRNDCLHYERDLALDKLRIEHLIGKHQVLDIGGLGPGGWSAFGNLLLTVLLICFVSSSFVVGLVVGRQVNDRLEHLTIVRQSFSAGSSGLRRMSQAFGFTRFYGGGSGGAGGADEQRRSFASEDQIGESNNDQIDDDYDQYYYGSTAIQMEEIKRNGTIKEEDETSADVDESAAAPAAAENKQKREDNPYEEVDIDVDAHSERTTTNNPVSETEASNSEQPTTGENLLQF